MENIRKQAVGVDISKDDFAVSLVFVLASDGAIKRVRRRKFTNNLKGFQAFKEWLDKYSLADVYLVIMMEATGVYHEELAYYLHDQHLSVSIQLANKVKAFAHSLNEYSKTDPIDADIIAQMAAERVVDLWQPASKNMLTIKSLSRQREQLISQRTRVMNQLHAHRHGACKSPQIILRYESLIELYEEMSEQIEREMEQLMKQETTLQNSVEHLTSLHGIGLVTALTIIAEMDGFRLFTSRSQVVSYAGYDIERKQSGSSLNSQGRISKRGNAHIRRALYMPSISAVSKPGIFKDIYDRIVERTGKKKMGLVAVQRKLLTTMYALQKNGTNYQADYREIPKNEVGKPNDLPTVTTLLESVFVS